MDRLPISEIFHSLQGEGTWSGTPSTFVRLAGCNLRCIWCDTPYASWEPEGEVQSIEQICQQIEHRHVVVTGGEPMIFDATKELCDALRKSGRVVTIETAGTRFQNLACDLMSISPKLSNSTPPSDTPGGWSQRHEDLRFQPDVLRSLMDSYRFQLKFVVTRSNLENDLAEIDAMLKELPAVAPESIFLMAEGTDSKLLIEAERDLSPVCLQRGWNLSSRLQIHLYGNSRGT